MKRAICWIWLFFATWGNAAELPAFSWDTIPRWGFLSFAGTAVTDVEARYIADNFSIATLFWIPGKTGERQRAEEMMLESAETLKTLNADLKLLIYWNSTLASDHYVAFREFEAHPAWKMVDRDGNDVTVRGKVLRYDVSNADLRDWWSDQAAMASQSPFIDGIFADAVAKIELNKKNLFESRMEAGDFEAAVNGMHEMLAQTQLKMGPDSLLIYNGLRGDLRPGMWAHGGADYLAESDGACVEHFLVHSARSPDGALRVSHVLRDIELIREASAQGKMVLVKAWPQTSTFLDPEFKTMSEAERRAILKREVTFPLAVFLIAAEKNCYLNYGFGYRRECLPLAHLSEYDHPLGAPLGKAVHDGLTFSRSFEHADVWVDLANESAKITWH